MFQNIKINSTKNKIDYIMIYLLISLSGNYVFGQVALILTFIVSFLTFVYRKKSLDIIFIFFILTLSVILLLQALKFDFYPWTTLFGFYIRVFTAYFIVKSVGVTFVDKFVKVMFVLSVISLLFFLLTNTIPDFVSMMKPFSFVTSESALDSANNIQVSYSTGIHTFKYMPYSHFNYTTNPGPFWEGGALAGYVMVAMILNTMITGQIINRKNLIFIVTIFSATATTALVALMALFFFYLLLSPKYKLLKVIMLPAISILSIFLFTYLDFLGMKIEQKIKLAQNPTIIYTNTSSRFVDALRDLNALEDHEIIGRGINLQTRLSKIDKQSSYTIRTNGLTDHLVRFGGIFFIITFMLMYFNFFIVNNYHQRLNNLFAIYIIFIIILLLQSETYFLYPLFWGLLFLYSGYIKNERD